MVADTGNNRVSIFKNIKYQMQEMDLGLDLRFTRFL